METTEHGSMDLTENAIRNPDAYPDEHGSRKAKKKRAGQKNNQNASRGARDEEHHAVAEDADERNAAEDDGGGKASEHIRDRHEDGNGRAGEFARSAERSNDDRIPDNLERWKAELREALGFDSSFEVQVREMRFGGRRVALLFLSVFARNDTLTEILKRLTYVDPGSLADCDALQVLLESYVPAAQIKRTSSFAEMTGEVMTGNTALYIEGEAAALLIDAREYPARNPEQPTLEKVVRGSQDGFTETLLVNVGLVRRRLRDPHLRFEMLKVGRRTKTDVCIGYIADIANDGLIEAIRDKIKAIDIDGLPLADKQLEEMTVKNNWSPFPLVRYTERPDVVAAQLLDGSVTVIVDTSPSAILLPTTYFDLVQHAEESRQNPFMGTYLRWVRYIGILASLFLLPLWYLFAENEAIRPEFLWFVGADKPGELPLVVQFLIAELGVDLLRLAAVHTPAPLVTAMTLLSAILIGDVAVKTGLFINEVILYMSISAIGMFATPSYELGLANRIVRLGLLVSVFAFQTIGFVVATTFVFLYMAMERSFNVPYLWPLLPFDGGALLSVLFRRPLPANKRRPSIYRTKTSRKQPV